MMAGTAHGAGTNIPLVQVNVPVMDPQATSLIPKEVIQNLCKIRGLEVETHFWAVAEGEWEKIEKKFADRVASSRGLILNVSNEIYLVVGFSAAFQGLLLTAASQGTRLTCKSKWWVLALSAFGTLAAAAAVWEKNRIIKWLQRSVDEDERTRETYAARLYSLQERGPGSFRFDQVVESEAGVPGKPHSYLQKFVSRAAKLIWPSYRYRVFYAVVLFGVLCALAIQYILCDNPA